MDEKKICISGVVQDRLFQGGFYRVLMKTENGKILYWDLPADKPVPDRGKLIKIFLDHSSVIIM